MFEISLCILYLYDSLRRCCGEGFRHGSSKVYAYLSRYNYNRLVTLSRNHRKVGYTLSIRYQLRENVKTLMLMRNLFYTSMTVMLILTAANLLLRFEKYQTDRTRQIVDIFYHSNPLTIVSAAVLTVGCYRKQFIGEVRKFCGLRAANGNVVYFENTKEMQKKADGDVYFEQLKKALNENIKIAVKK
ncbi:unnamed protein product [Caenorhabditis auriculariae]|uniref:Uncharacterized protein n=1 Tax=Caenorhabditis auriculariae TaxID=2777116 RepID=A0A8S1H880_9PELO|nr:unnamed protein product [Caenorhabditis auriculariae]